VKDIKITFTKYDHLPTEVYAEDVLVGTIDDQGFFYPNQAYRQLLTWNEQAQVDSKVQEIFSLK
jgi:hypothetical protein